MLWCFRLFLAPVKPIFPRIQNERRLRFGDDDIMPMMTAYFTEGAGMQKPSSCPERSEPEIANAERRGVCAYENAHRAREDGTTRPG